MNFGCLASLSIGAGLCSKSVKFMGQVVKCLLLVREIRGSNSKPIKSFTRCQQPATAATLMFGSWRKAAEMSTSHSLHPTEYLASIIKI